MKVDMSKFFDQKTTFNLIIFSSAALSTFIIWLLLGKVFLPIITEINTQTIEISQEINTQFNSSLATTIEEKRSFTNSQLSDFQIYLLNNKVNYNTGELNIKYFQSVSPPDLAYSTLMQNNLINN